MIPKYPLDFTDINKPYQIANYTDVNKIGFLKKYYSLCKYFFLRFAFIYGIIT